MPLFQLLGAAGILGLLRLVVAISSSLSSHGQLPSACVSGSSSLSLLMEPGTDFGPHYSSRTLS